MDAKNLRCRPADVAKHHPASSMQIVNKTWLTAFLSYPVAAPGARPVPFLVRPLSEASNAHERAFAEEMLDHAFVQEMLEHAFDQ